MAGGMREATRHVRLGRKLPAERVAICQGSQSVIRGRYSPRRLAPRRPKGIASHGLRCHGGRRIAPAVSAGVSRRCATHLMAFALSRRPYSVKPTTAHAWLDIPATDWGVAGLADNQIAFTPVLVLRQRMSARPSPL